MGQVNATRPRTVDLGEDPEGSTPITDEQRAGLRPTWIATRADLNEAEADNILSARLNWRPRIRATGSRRLTVERLLDHIAVRELHRDMYGDVWAWAGSYRTTDTNIGVAWHRVPMATSDLLADALYWFAGAQPMPVDKAATRFHHKLVEIHPFPNGNGRHAREITDLLLLAMGSQPFSWGSANLGEPTKTRRKYIDSLVMADIGQYDDLEAFVRS